MILFLYGEDTYRSKKKLDEIRAKFLRDIDPSGLNLQQIDGEKAEIGDIRSAVSAAPFLAKKRMVVLTDAIMNAGKKEAEPLAELLDDVPEDTILVVRERVDTSELEGAPAYDKLKNGKFYPEFKPLGPKEIQAWILSEAKERGVEFLKDGLTAYLPVAGNDAWKIGGELDALAATARAEGSNRISAEAVRSLAHLQAAQSVFDFLDAVGTRRADLAVRLLDALLEQGESEVALLSRLQGHVRGLLIAADLSVLGQATKERVAREVGAHPFAAAKLVSQSRYFKPHELERLYVKLIDADEQLKRGGWPKARAALDLFLAEIAETMKTP
ncbi:MAG: DNA polymerase III subunit delta [Patescibacteria group bacterium]